MLGPTLYSLHISSESRPIATGRNVLKRMFTIVFKVLFRLSSD